MYCTSDSACCAACAPGSVKLSQAAQAPLLRGTISSGQLVQELLEVFALDDVVVGRARAVNHGLQHHPLVLGSRLLLQALDCHLLLKVVVVRGTVVLDTVRGAPLALEVTGQLDVRDPEQIVDLRRWLPRGFATTFAQDQGHLKI